MKPRIVYVSWPPAEITGGSKMIFGHVATLVEAGFNATVASSDPTPPAWLSKSAPLIGLSEIDRDSDILVFPENHTGFLAEFATSKNRKKVFCQNQYQVFRGLGDRRHYADYGVTEIISQSQHVSEFCHLRFPDTKISMIPCYVDETLFHLETSKRLQIAFMPRKRPHELYVIRDLFAAAHPDLADVPWRAIDNLPEKDVATVLKQSGIYLSLNQFESFGLSSLEAMACGCLVTGFTGFGAREYATTDNGFWAAEADVLEACEKLAQAVRLTQERWSLYQYMIERGIQTAQGYSRAAFRERLIAYWQRELDSCD